MTGLDGDCMDQEKRRCLVLTETNKGANNLSDNPPVDVFDL
jgi:hypothetical protein